MRKLLSNLYWFFIKKSKFSQGEEEKILSEIFKNKKNGFYVDVGCHHPKRFSNTAKLYKNGWSGINIDADIKTIKLFDVFRKRDNNIQAFISETELKLKYTILNDSALNGNLTKERINILEKKGYKVLKTIEIETITLDNILKSIKPQLKKIDLLDIDVEGHDIKVLKSIDLTKFLVNVILIELSGEIEEEVTAYLKRYNYKLFKRVDRNCIYIKI